MLVKIRISPNEIVILQYIAEEVDSFWVVPVGHAHCRVGHTIKTKVTIAKCCFDANIFATERKEILHSHKYLLVHMQKTREVLDHRLLAIAAAL